VSYESLLRSVGCVDHIPADGSIHRFKIEGRGKRNGCAGLHQPGDAIFGAAGNWATGDRISIKHGNVDRQVMAATIAKVEKRNKVSAANAQIEAGKRWSRAGEAGYSRYLSEKKQVKAFGLRFESAKGYGIAETILIPMSDSDGGLHGLQSITPDGSKLFTKGCAKRGKFHRIPGKTAIIIAEGYATAASIHMATGFTTIVAFDAGNLLPVALEIWRRNKTPLDGRVIIAADGDKVGIEQAQRAAGAIGALMIAAPEGRDFNDVHVEEGLPAVSALIYSRL